MKDITIKEVIEHYFNNHEPLPCIYYNVGDKKMWHRTIESYNPETGDFTIKSCKDKFNLNTSWITITIESRDNGWADLVCKHIWGKPFKEIQSQVESNANYDKENTTVNEIGGSWMKYTASHPRFIRTKILGVDVEAVKTYSTATNFKAEGYYFGHTYSNTSTRWAYEAGLVNHYVSFHTNPNTNND